MDNVRVIASGLRFPEGPIAMPNGSVLLVEMRGATLTRVSPNGAVDVMVETGGGPNGAAVGPDGAIYVCNNGGFDADAAARRERDGSGGYIQRADLGTGTVSILYEACDGVPLSAPNDIVFDSQGGFYFTDFGHRRERGQDYGAVYYAQADGSAIRRVVKGMLTPNGIGLSPDGQRLYVAETMTGRVWAFDVVLPGLLREEEARLAPSGATLLAGLPGFQLFDSLAVDSEGNVCVGTLMNSGITVIAPTGGVVRHVPIEGDQYITNICFGGPQCRTAFITGSLSGQLFAVDWPVPGAPLAYGSRG